MPDIAYPEFSRHRAGSAVWRCDPNDRYDSLEPSVFHEKWWLDIVTGGRWQYVESLHHGCVVGRLPYLSGKWRWFRTIHMPQLTHFLGPAITPGSGGSDTRLLRRIGITRDLIRQLPPGNMPLKLKMQRDIDDVIAFQMEGFETAVRFTYEIEPAPSETIWRGMRDKTRNVARKAATLYSVDDDMDPEEFIRLFELNVAVRGWRSIFDMTVARTVIAASRQRNRGRVLAVRDRDGVAKAAIFCVWDHAACYYVLSTRSPDSSSGAITLLLWVAIQSAVDGGLVFDFDGLAHDGIVLLYSGFGAEVKTRFVVSRTTLAFRLAQEARRLFRQPESPFH
nr:GNAT family N-acetyltransferase [uncultured Rhodopila sp.]